MALPKWVLTPMESMKASDFLAASGAAREMCAHKRIAQMKMTARSLLISPSPVLEANRPRPGFHSLNVLTSALVEHFPNRLHGRIDLICVTERIAQLLKWFADIGANSWTWFEIPIDEDVRWNFVSECFAFDPHRGAVRV